MRHVEGLIPGVYSASFGRNITSLSTLFNVHLLWIALLIGLEKLPALANALLRWSVRYSSLLKKPMETLRELLICFGRLERYFQLLLSLLRIF